MNIIQNHSQNSPTKLIEATHSDGDGNVIICVNEPDGVNCRYICLSKEQALFLMASLAKAVSQEYGDFKASKKI